MFTSREGQRVPDVTLRVRQDGQWKDITTKELFGGKTVVVFALPGAFTPTCSTAHVPRYNELFPGFKAKGVDEIVCVSVNDSFVMDAWKQDQKADHITFVPDGNGVFSDAMGMLVDKANLGFGKRSWRYSMLVRDGVIEKQFIEPEVEGDPYEVSDADTMYKYIGGQQQHDVLLFTKPGCSHCARAKRLLEENHLTYAELPSSPRILRALPGAHTTPQVFVDGKHLGGADELEQWLKSNTSAKAS
ncbi:glutathione peroxidase [Chondromyces apiculatus]|uniref:Peroxiredoxin family protein/glutaredoxin n=1 Tax=Chondromyces apiculatus DSM 436 TaxID=1192034 RepID=A0A017T3A5_9BACT|nr:glutathione peroxidase [Chondromyces apiculatus]EYF03467.1 Peroxiredoxin family protein/glutaredoxin [Chondromyces apiculatus DSM 436]